MSNNAREHKISQIYVPKLEKFVEALGIELDTCLAKRLVRTRMLILLILQAILKFRPNAKGLLLSELGGYILNPRQASTGTKQISTLLRSPKWTYRIIAWFLWRRADQRITELVADEESSLLVDGSIYIRHSK